MRKRILPIIISLLLIVLIVFGGKGYLSVSEYTAENVLFSDNETSSIVSDSGIAISRLSSGNVEFVPQDIKAGLIFYPGGSVEYTAYAPLLERLAQKGFLCVLVKMPLDLAVLDNDRAEGIQKNYPDIDKWYIGGHSLGGAMAGTYLSKTDENYDGLVLLASYSSSDISSLDIDVVSVYGSNDGVMNREHYEKYKSNLPDNFNEYIIEGGCHSYFGAYGMQKNDGTPTITREQQLDITADYILSSLNIQ